MRSTTSTSSGRQKLTHRLRPWAEGIAQAWVGSSRGIFVWSCQNCGKWSSPFPSKYWPDVPRAELTYERPGDGATKDERVEMAKATAELTCPHCGTGLDDKQRHRMVDGGQWMHRGQTLDVEIGICGEAESNRARGFWIHGTMSKMISNAELAEEYESALAEFDATKKPEKLRQVTAKVLGEPYEGSGSGAKMDGAALIQRRNDLVSDGGGFAIGEFPTGALFATQSIDVGHNKFDIGVWAWDAEGRSWLVERKTIRQRVWPDLQLRDIRPVENILDWQVLVPEIDRMLPMQGKPGWAMPIAVTLIDSGDGNVTWKAYEFCRQMAARKWGGFTKVKAIKGNSSAKAPEVPVSGLRISKDERGAPVKPEILMFTLGVHQLREKALERLATDDGGPGECFFASGISRKALDEFYGERLIDGKWVRTGDNETLDLFGYAEAGRQMLNPDRPGINWSSPPPWAKPVPLTRKGGDHAVEAKRQDESPAGNQQTSMLTALWVAGWKISRSRTSRRLAATASAVPDAGAFLLGRILVAAKMAEVRIATAVPASAAALGSGSTTTAAVLGSDAAATAHLYKGLGLTLSDIGSTTRAQLTAIRAYAADKTATLMQTLSDAPAANYQIPTQLSYQRSIVAGDAPFASQRIWVDGHRYDLVNNTLTSLRVVIPASTREGAAFPELEVTWAVTIHADADEGTPVVPSLGPTPKWRDGKFFMSGLATPGSNLTLDSGLSVGYPPNPNKEEGNDAPQLIEAKASLTFERHHRLKAIVDQLAQADAQAQHGVYAQWGYTAGGIVQLVVPDARFNYASPNLGGGFVTESGDMFIDALDKGFCLNFPYPA